MSSADPEYMVIRPVAQTLWIKTNQAGSCSFLVESKIPPGLPHMKYGAPDTVWTTVTVNASSVAAQGDDSTTIDLTVTWLNKTTTRMAESSWVSFIPNVRAPSTGWQISSLGSQVDPTRVVEHGATHLHAMGPDGAMVYSGADGSLTIASLDVPVVSTGVLSPFPTPGTFSGGIGSTLQQGGTDHTSM